MRNLSPGVDIGNGFCEQRSDAVDWVNHALTCNITLRREQPDPMSLGDLTSSYIPVHYLAPCGQEISRNDRVGILVCNDETAIVNDALYYKRLPPGFGTEWYKDALYYTWHMTSVYRWGYSRLGGIDMRFCVDDYCEQDSPVIYSIDLWIEDTPKYIVSQITHMLLSVGTNNAVPLVVSDREDLHGLIYDMTIDGLAPPSGLAINAITGRVNLPLATTDYAMRSGNHSLTITVSDPFGSPLSVTKPLWARHYAPIQERPLTQPPKLFAQDVYDHPLTGAFDRVDGDAVRWRFINQSSELLAVQLWHDDVAHFDIGVNKILDGTIKKGVTGYLVQPCDIFDYCGPISWLYQHIGNIKGQFVDLLTPPPARVGSEVALHVFSDSSIVDVDNVLDDYQLSASCTRADGDPVATKFDGATIRFTPLPGDEATSIICERIADDGDEQGTFSQQVAVFISNIEPYVQAGAPVLIEGLSVLRSFQRVISNMFYDPDDPEFERTQLTLVHAPGWLSMVIEKNELGLSLVFSGQPPVDAPLLDDQVIIRMQDPFLRFAIHVMRLQFDIHAPVADNAVVVAGNAYAGDVIRIDLNGRCTDNDLGAIVDYHIAQTVDVNASHIDNEVVVYVDQSQPEGLQAIGVTCVDQYFLSSRFDIHVTKINRAVTILLEQINVGFVHAPFFMQLSDDLIFDPDGNAFDIWWENLPPWGLQTQQRNLSAESILPSATFNSLARLCSKDSLNKQFCKNIAFEKQNSPAYLSPWQSPQNASGLNYRFPMGACIDPDEVACRIEIIQSSHDSIYIQSNALVINPLVTQLNQWFSGVVRATDGSKNGITDYMFSVFRSFSGIEFTSPFDVSRIPMGGQFQEVLRLTPASVRNEDGADVVFDIDLGSMSSESYWGQCQVIAENFARIVTVKCFSFLPRTFDIGVTARPLIDYSPKSVSQTKSAQVYFEWDAGYMWAIYIPLLLAVVGILFKMILQRSRRNALTDAYRRKHKASQKIADLEQRLRYSQLTEVKAYTSYDTLMQGAIEKLQLIETDESSDDGQSLLTDMRLLLHVTSQSIKVGTLKKQLKDQAIATLYHMSQFFCSCHFSDLSIGDLSEHKNYLQVYLDLATIMKGWCVDLSLDMIGMPKIIASLLDQSKVLLPAYRGGETMVEVVSALSSVLQVYYHHFAMNADQAVMLKTNKTFVWSRKLFSRCGCLRCDYCCRGVDIAAVERRDLNTHASNAMLVFLNAMKTTVRDRNYSIDEMEIIPLLAVLPMLLPIRVNRGVRKKLQSLCKDLKNIFDSTERKAWFANLFIGSLKNYYHGIHMVSLLAEKARHYDYFIDNDDDDARKFTLKYYARQNHWAVVSFVESKLVSLLQFHGDDLMMRKTLDVLAYIGEKRLVRTSKGQDDGSEPLRYRQRMRYLIPVLIDVYLTHVSLRPAVVSACQRYAVQPRQEWRDEFGEFIAQYWHHEHIASLALLCESLFTSLLVLRNDTTMRRVDKLFEAILAKASDYSLDIQVVFMRHWLRVYNAVRTPRAHTLMIDLLKTLPSACVADVSLLKPQAQSVAIHGGSIAGLLGRTTLYKADRAASPQRLSKRRMAEVTVEMTTTAISYNNE